MRNEDAAVVRGLVVLGSQVRHALRELREGPYRVWTKRYLTLLLVSWHMDPLRGWPRYLLVSLMQ